MILATHILIILAIVYICVRLIGGLIKIVFIGALLKVAASAVKRNE